MHFHISEEMIKPATATLKPSPPPTNDSVRQRPVSPFLDKVLQCQAISAIKRKCNQTEEVESLWKVQGSQIINGIVVHEFLNRIKNLFPRRIVVLRQNTSSGEHFTMIYQAKNRAKEESCSWRLHSVCPSLECWERPTKVEYYFHFSYRWDNNDISLLPSVPKEQSEVPSGLNSCIHVPTIEKESRRGNYWVAVLSLRMKDTVKKGPYEIWLQYHSETQKQHSTFPEERASVAKVDQVFTTLYRSIRVGE